jgi:hypothetical protein
MPQETRTTAPAGLTSMAGAVDAPGGAVSVTIGTKATPPGSLFRVAASEYHGAPHTATQTPVADTPASDAPLPIHALLVPASRQQSAPSRPQTSADDAQDFNSPKAALRVDLRVIVNVVHSDSSKPLASRRTSIAAPAMEEGR